jgi:hypothetical protein
MIRNLRLIFLLQIVALAASPVYAQVATGTPPYGSFAGGPDVINLANLNSHITIPVLHKAGRGMNFTYDLSQDTSVWFPSSSGGTNTWTPAGVGNWGWRGQTEVTTGYVSRTATTITCPNPEYPPALPKTVRDEVFSNFVYHDTFGVSHPFNGMTFDPGLCGGQSSASGTATDGSGYTLTVTLPSTFVNTITSTTGDVIIAPSSGAGTASKTERNGNLITVNGSGQFFDTMSSTTPVLTVAGSGTPASPETFTYTAPSGSAVYTVKYTQYSIQTNFGCSGITEYGTNGTTTADLVSEIDLPDISADKYSFTYEATPGHTGFVTGRLATVTLPTGGTITYTCTGGSSGHITCADGSAATLTRATPDGTWTYAHSESGSAWTTLISDPQGNQTNMDFQGIYETQRLVYQGTTSGTLLRQWTTCYNGNTSNCNTTAITLPIAQRTVIDQ